MIGEKCVFPRLYSGIIIRMKISILLCPPLRRFPKADGQAAETGGIGISRLDAITKAILLEAPKTSQPDF